METSKVKELEIGNVFIIPKSLVGNRELKTLYK